jgi:hypothetical protein
MPVKQETRGQHNLRQVLLFLGPQVLLFLGIVALQGFAALASALGCGDDGPVDYGTANAAQRRYCEVVPFDEFPFLLLFSSPLVVFTVVTALTELRSRWKPLLAALPFLSVTGLLPLALWIDWSKV